MKTKSIEKIIKLIVKLGLFFAHCDGSYSAKERSFISHFVEKLADMGNIDDIKDVLGDSINKTYTLDEVVADTNDLLDDFQGNDRAAIKATLLGFAQQVINSDNNECKAELANLDAWWSKLI